MILFVSLLIGGCGSVSAPASAPVDVPSGTDAPVVAGANGFSGDLVVFAAASLTEAFVRIGDEFMQQHPDVTLIFSFAGSQQLAQQIDQGAPVDIFASANAQQMEVATRSGRIDPESISVFVHNRLVIVVPYANEAGLVTLNDLAQPGHTLIVAAPEVPVGSYTRDFLERAGADAALGPDYVNGVEANIVSYEENVRAVLSKVALDEADAGIVYSSDTAGQGTQIQTIEIPDELNTIVLYPIAYLSDAPNLAAAQAFVELVLAETGQAILAEYGFIPVHVSQP